MSDRLLRSCSGCSAHILTWDGNSDMVFCAKCRPTYVKPFEEWAAGLTVGSQVYVQPIVADPYATWVIEQRDGDQVVLGRLNVPNYPKVTTTIGQLLQIRAVRT